MERYHLMASISDHHEMEERMMVVRRQMPELERNRLLRSGMLDQSGGPQQYNIRNYQNNNNNNVNDFVADPCYSLTQYSNLNQYYPQYAAGTTSSHYSSTGLHEYGQLQPILDVGTTHSIGHQYGQPPPPPPQPIISDVLGLGSGGGHGHGHGRGRDASFEFYNGHQDSSSTAVRVEIQITYEDRLIWEQATTESYSHERHVSGSTVVAENGYRSSTSTGLQLAERHNRSRHERSTTTTTTTLRGMTGSPQFDHQLLAHAPHLFRSNHLPEDEVVVLDFSDDYSDRDWPYHLAPPPATPNSDTFTHSNLSYEDLLELEQLIGRVNMGLSEDTIVNHLNTRTHVSSAANQDDEEEPEICVICQAEYEKNETIATLQCGHEYHADCIKTWLHQRNVCPICKAPALI